MKTNEEVSFTSKKLKNVIKKLNISLIDLDNKINESENNENTKKFINYINKYSDSLKNSNDREILEFLNTLIKDFSEKVYISQGDDLMESLWKLYRINIEQLNFNPDTILYKLANDPQKIKFEISNNPEYFLNMILMNENLTNKILDDKIIVFDKENNKIDFHLEMSIFQTLLGGLDTQTFHDNDMINKIKINNILDLVFLKILVKGNIKTFYTVLSSMLMLTEGKTILIFKIISFYAICLFSFENKDAFVGSLLFIIGGMLRDYARSYLKTKSIERFQFSEHKCNHENHDDKQFFEISTLSQIECEFLENNFLQIIKEFLSIIIYKNFHQSEKLSKWDNFRQIFVKYIFIENFDMEENIPQNVQIIHYFTLFITEFFFNFICGFCDFNIEKNCFTTNFKNFDHFAIFALNFLSSQFTNVLSILEFANKKLTITQIDCEKTEYVLTDKFNTYGTYLLTLLSINYSLNKSHDLLSDNMINNYLNNRMNKFIPLILQKEYYLKIILETLYEMISIEKKMKYKLCLFLNKIIEGNLKLIGNLVGSEISFSNQISDTKKKKFEYVDYECAKYFALILINYFRIDECYRNNNIPISFFKLFRDKNFIFYETSKQVKSIDDYKLLVNIYEESLLANILQEKTILSTILILLVKGINDGFILETSVIDKINQFFYDTKNQFKFFYKIAINNILDELMDDHNSLKKLITNQYEMTSELYPALLIKDLENKDNVISVFNSMLKNIE